MKSDGTFAQIAHDFGQDSQAGMTSLAQSRPNPPDQGITCLVTHLKKTFRGIAWSHPLISEKCTIFQTHWLE